jgi:hypothetical protein
VTYDVEGPEPVRKRSMTKPLRTAIVLALLAVAVLVAGRWGWEQLTQPFGDAAAAASPTPTATTAGTCPPVEVPLPAPSTITVNVYNAGRVQGLAGTAAEQLAARGFVIGAVDNDPLGKNLDGVGEIRSAPGSEPQVKTLLQYVPGATWVQDGRADATLDFAAGAGFTGVVDPPPAPAPTPVPGC